jgi:hypothetical protein
MANPPTRITFPQVRKSLFGIFRKRGVTFSKSLAVSSGEHVAGPFEFGNRWIRSDQTVRAKSSSPERRHPTDSRPAKWNVTGVSRSRNCSGEKSAVSTSTRCGRSCLRCLDLLCLRPLALSCRNFCGPRRRRFHAYAMEHPEDRNSIERVIEFKERVEQEFERLYQRSQPRRNAL